MIEMLSGLIFYDTSNRTTNFKTVAEPSFQISGRIFLVPHIIPEGYHYFLFIFNEDLRLMKLKISDS